MSNFTSLNLGANGSLQTDVILQEALDTFLRDLGFFGAIHKDFGGQAMRFNQSLITRIFTARSTNDVTSAYTAPVVANPGAGVVAAPGTIGYTLGNEDTDADPVSIKLDQHKFIKFHLTDLEREESEVTLVADAAKHASHALARSVAEDMLTLGINNASTAAIGNIAQNAFGIDDLFGIAEQMDGLDMPSDGRWLVLSPQAYYTLLSGLTTITNSTYSVASGISEALLDQRLAGFQIYTYNGLNTLQANEGVDLLAGYGGSLAMVNRLPEFADASMQLGDIANASDPSTGLSLQLRRKYDVFVAKEEYALTLMYGLKAPNDGTQNRMLKINVT